jgi:hypothetical protein
MAHFINRAFIYTIDLKLDNYIDIYCKSPYCDSAIKNLSPEFLLFLHNNVEKAPKGSFLELRFHLPLHLKDTDCEEKIIKSIQNHYFSEVNNLLEILNESYKHIVKYSIIASLLIITGFILQLSQEKSLFIFTILEIINITAWVFLWEAIHTFCFKNKSLSSALRECKSIYSSNIKFEYKAKNAQKS